MRTIETSDWVILNDIIYDIYTMEDFSDMQFHFLEHMQMILDFDAAVFSLPSREALTAINSFTTLPLTCFESDLQTVSGMPTFTLPR